MRVLKQCNFLFRNFLRDRRSHMKYDGAEELNTNIFLPTFKKTSTQIHYDNIPYKSCYNGIILI